MPATDDARAILDKLRQLVRALRTFDREAQSKYGVGAAQMFILHVLAHEEDAISMNELSERTATDQSSVSLAVARLVDDGFVQREPSEKDRRRVHLTLTRKGRALVRRAPPAAQERLLESVSAMPSRERKQLLNLLEKLMGGLDAGRGRPPMFFQD